MRTCSHARGKLFQRTIAVFFCGPTLVFAATQDNHLMIISCMVFTFVIFLLFGRTLGLFTELIAESLYVSLMIYFFRLGLMGGKLQLFWVADGLLAVVAVLYLVLYAENCRKIQEEIKENGPKLARAQRKEKKEQERAKASEDRKKVKKSVQPGPAKAPMRM